MSKAPTLRQFQDRFPTEESCLDHLFRVRFGTDFNCPGCDRPAKFSRVKARRSYQCQWCAHQVYPTAGTPFDRTRTPLRDWFYVMFQFVTTRNGVAAKRFERDLGVTYKTAWRMCHEIRKYMASLDSDDPLGGPGSIVENNEMLVGGSVSGMCQGYKDLDQCGFQHVKVNHAAGEYAKPCGAGVNSIEGFWALLKRGINGTYIHVSGKHLPKYLGEFEYLWNMRQVPHLMLDRMMYSFAR